MVDTTRCIFSPFFSLVPTGPVTWIPLERDNEKACGRFVYNMAFEERKLGILLQQ